MWVEALDHLVLTVADEEASAAFYVLVLGMERVVFGLDQGSRRLAVQFGQQKINLHPAAAPLAPHASRPTPGSADLCFVSARPLSDWIAHLAAAKVAVEQGPVCRTGARGPMQSIYFRDPDGNLIEIAWYGAA
jgi:catechol 2,3-dioxygenase-like lactoylglutathione lyase family enzyme